MKSNLVATVSATINAPASKVWKALTTPELIKQYLFGTEAVSDWKVGSPLIFRGEWEGKAYEDKGVILRSEVNKVFSYTYWSSMSGTPDIPENYLEIAYLLTESGNQTTLTINQENVPSEESKTHSEQNWGGVLKGLKDIVEQ
jgi:uncharacterized protein YndB with AHSA1/START domain